MSNTNYADRSKEVMYEDDDIESLIPNKYKDLDDVQFEKFNKRNDWD